jgi:diguanylate cyclase (GGDEF)-like protein
MSTVAPGFASSPFGMSARVRRPVLLILVYGIFLMIVGVTATAQAVMVSAHFSTNTLSSIVSTDTTVVRAFVQSFVSPDDFAPGTLPSERQAVIERQLRTLVAPETILRVEVRRPDGTVIFADDPTLRGASSPSSAAFDQATTGESASVDIVDVGASNAAGPPLATSTVVREYFPLSLDGKVVGIVGVWRDAVPILAQLDEVRRNIVIVTLSAALVAAFVLFLVFRSAQGRITRQTQALIDSTQRDPVTGTLNHGALVDAVARSVDEARDKGTAFAVALVDIDNFRLLNETYTHAAGDRALLTIVDLFGRDLPAGVILGRYGPDELLLLAPATEISALGVLLEQARTALADHALQFDASERLPLTVSVGVCTFPEHGESVTELLTSAALTLQEAKASGGDAIRYAGQDAAPEPETRTFDVYQGLIFAVDTKDRYTKRHSGDVARYSVFLAERMGAQPDFIQTVRVAGLLHDVGKIGIPDHILRKPGTLTLEEYEIVQQHVVLGDMIVRDLPDVELIRAGVRHHHERWDGTGYVDRLSGADIPLIARILAVSDAFSAMTTTRPYRKALAIEEALRRLEDAAGTQLDEDLVVAFVHGIQNVAGAPLPGMDAPRLWTPYASVA